MDNTNNDEPLKKNMKNTILKIALFSFACKLSAQPIPVPTQTDPNISSPVASGDFIYPASYDNDVIAPTVNSVATANCSASSSDYTTKYARFQTYIPTINTPIKTIKVALHFFQKADGSNMWQDNAYTTTTFNLAIDWLNHRNQYIDQPSSPIPGVPYIQDSRIRYELTGIYFYQNDALNAFGQAGNIAPLENAVIAADPTRLESMPLYYTAKTGAGYSGYAIYPTTNFLQNSYSVVFNNGTNGDGSATLAHEIGHCLDLMHTYNSDALYQSNTEYLELPHKLNHFIFRL